jgi:ABC-type protease/lipase transport system fused ATPase/permease subunit
MPLHATYMIPVCLVMWQQDGYGTLVGDGSGTTLSSRDVLRLVLARALIRRPKVRAILKVLWAA